MYSHNELIFVMFRTKSWLCLLARPPTSLLQRVESFPNMFWSLPLNIEWLSHSALKLRKLKCLTIRFGWVQTTLSIKNIHYPYLQTESNIILFSISQVGNSHIRAKYPHSDSTTHVSSGAFFFVLIFFSFKIKITVRCTLDVICICVWMCVLCTGGTCSIRGRKESRSGFSRGCKGQWLWTWTSSSKPPPGSLHDKSSKTRKITFTIQFPSFLSKIPRTKTQTLRIFMLRLTTGRTANRCIYFMR